MHTNNDHAPTFRLTTANVKRIQSLLSIDGKRLLTPENRKALGITDRLAESIRACGGKASTSAIATALGMQNFTIDAIKAGRIKPCGGDRWECVPSTMFTTQGKRLTFPKAEPNTDDVGGEATTMYARRYTDEQLREAFASHPLHQLREPSKVTLSGLLSRQRHL